MKGAFISALAVVGGNVASCQSAESSATPGATPTAACSASRGGKVCGTNACNGIIKKLEEQSEDVEVKGYEDGTFLTIDSDEENGCELAVAPRGTDDVSIEASYIIEDIYNLMEACAGSVNETNAEWAGEINSDSGDSPRVVEVFNPVAEGC